MGNSPFRRRSCSSSTTSTHQNKTNVGGEFFINNYRGSCSTSTMLHQQQSNYNQNENDNLANSNIRNMIKNKTSKSSSIQSGHNADNNNNGSNNDSTNTTITANNNLNNNNNDINDNLKKRLLINNDFNEMIEEPIECEKLRSELLESKRQVYEREQQLLKLHREVHKLRSVLDHSDAINALKTNDISSSFDLLMVNNGPGNNGEGNNLPPEKKKGVSGESFGLDRTNKIHNISFVWKDFDCRRIIQEALMDNSFLKNYLNQEQLDLIVNSMYEKEFAKDCYICRRGTYGSNLYVITYGHCEVIDARDRPVNQMGPGKAFGELALLYNCTRTASVKTLTRVRTWVLDRKAFQIIMMKTSMDRTQNIKQFLKKVPLLQKLSDEKITKISDAVEVDYFPRGEYICRQGSFGDSFYIISKGSVKVTQIKPKINSDNNNNNNNDNKIQVCEETIRTLSVGDYFGEQALLLLESAATRGSLNPELIHTSISTNTVSTISQELSDNIGAVRTANVISEECECLVLDQVNFFNLLGELQEIKYKSYNNYINGNSQNNNFSNNNNNINNHNDAFDASNPSSMVKSTNESLDPFKMFIKNLQLNDLEVLTQLGMGGFGIVNLVRHKTDPDQVFAMKKCSKEFIRSSRQQHHIINEKLVMQKVAGKNQFIIELYRTFQDELSIYFLMETALGGELWTVLRQRGPFNELAVRFYAACVMEALDYLHSLNIIYRDLKPENCLLDADGYLKLTDFGFSKPLQRGDKTWTFCGTPEYVAPEIILNRGHDKSVDIWSLGILIYELLTGMPPFVSSDPLQTYHIILRGFDSIGFDEKIFSKHCVNLIRNLCRENPAERLGIRGRNGYNDIKRHKWFIGFNWNNLTRRKMPAPFVPKLTSNTDTRHFDCFFNVGSDVNNTIDESLMEQSHSNDQNNNHLSNSKDNLLLINNTNKKFSTTGPSSSSQSWFKTISSNLTGSPKTHVPTTTKTNNENFQTNSNNGGENYHSNNDEDNNPNVDDGFLESILDWESYF